MMAALLLACCLVAPNGSVYDAHGRRQGYIRESRPGHFDVYDTHSRRLGYGRVAPDGRIDSLRSEQPAAVRDPAGADGAVSYERGRDS